MNKVTLLMRTIVFDRNVLAIDNVKRKLRRSSRGKRFVFLPVTDVIVNRCWYYRTSETVNKFWFYRTNGTLNRSFIFVFMDKCYSLVSSTETWMTHKHHRLALWKLLLKLFYERKLINMNLCPLRTLNELLQYQW